MDISRRRFFMFMGAAAATPIIHHIIPEKLIFDMSMPIKLSTLDQLNTITLKYINPILADEVFKDSPFFKSIRHSPYYGDQLLSTKIEDIEGWQEAILING